MPTTSCGAGQLAVGVRRADADVLLAGVAVQQRGERGDMVHEQGQPVRPAELPDRGRQLRRQLDAQGVAPEGLDRRARPVRQQAGVGIPALAVPRPARRAGQSGSAGSRSRSPSGRCWRCQRGVVGVLQRRLGQRRRLAGGVGVVQGLSSRMSSAKDQPSCDDVVLDERPARARRSASRDHASSAAAAGGSRSNGRRSSRVRPGPRRRPALGGRHVAEVDQAGPAAAGSARPATARRRPGRRWCAGSRAAGQLGRPGPVAERRGRAGRRTRIVGLGAGRRCCPVPAGVQEPDLLLLDATAVPAARACRSAPAGRRPAGRPGAAASQGGQLLAWWAGREHLDRRSRPLPVPRPDAGRRSGAAVSEWPPQLEAGRRSTADPVQAEDVAARSSAEPAVRSSVPWRPRRSPGWSASVRVLRVGSAARSTLPLGGSGSCVDGDERGRDQVVGQRLGGRAR